MNRNLIVNIKYIKQAIVSFQLTAGPDLQLRVSKLKAMAVIFCRKEVTDGGVACVT